jgi:hypothetical protein
MPIELIDDERELLDRPSDQRRRCSRSAGGSNPRRAQAPARFRVGCDRAPGQARRRRAIRRGRSRSAGVARTRDVAKAPGCEHERRNAGPVSMFQVEPQFGGLRNRSESSCGGCAPQSFMEGRPASTTSRRGRPPRGSSGFPPTRSGLPRRPDAATTVGLRLPCRRGSNSGPGHDTSRPWHWQAQLAGSSSRSTGPPDDREPSRPLP